MIGGKIMQLYPLTYQQKRLYIYSKMNSNDIEYNVVEGLLFKENINHVKLEYAFDRMLVEQPILRCRILEKNFEPYQYAANKSEYKIQYISVDEEQLEITINEIKTKAFELNGGPLFVVYVLKVSNNRNIIIFVIHHIISDGWSLKLLSKMFLKYYYEVEDSLVSEKGLTYFEYAKVQKEDMISGLYENRSKFWNENISNIDKNIPISYDYKKNNIYSRKGKRKIFYLDKIQSQRVDQFSKNVKISPFSLIISVYADLFHRYYNIDKFAIAVPVANRFKKNIMSTIGYFVNTIPIKFDFTERMSVEKRLKSQHSFFMKCISRSDISIDCPINVMFVFQGKQEGILESYISDKFEMLRIHNSKSKYEVSLSVTFEEGRYCFEWEYMTELFKEESIDKYNKYMVNLLKGYLDSTDIITEKINILDEQEVNIQKYIWNDTFKEYRKNVTLKELLEEASKKYESEVALKYEGKYLTYRESNNYANVLCLKLYTMGIRQGDIVPIMFNRGFEMVIAIQAIIKLGGAYLPLDKDMPSERIRYVLKDSNAKIVLVSDELKDNLIGLTQYYVLEMNKLKGEEANPLTKLEGKDAAYIIYTSGSTGNPKGVVNIHDGICNRLLWMQEQFPIGPKKKVLHKTPYTFDVSVWELIWPLIVGATIVIAKPNGHKDPEYIVDIIKKEKINVIHFVPSMLKNTLKANEYWRDTSLNYVICSGEALEIDTVRKYYSLLDVQLVNLYGPTEAAIDVTCKIIDKNSVNDYISIGKPISNIRLYKLNDELMFTPPEVPGELYISGIGLARGYLNDKEKTESVFLRCPWDNKEPYERIYRTGDIVKFDCNGDIIYLNRKDFQVKLRGQRIELGEIEKTIKEIEFVEDAIVMVKENLDGQQLLVAYVKARIEEQQAIIEYISQFLMDYMVPQKIKFIKEIPLNSNGKVDRKKLASLEFEFDTKEEDDNLENYYEMIVAEAFKEVLHMNNIGRNSDFYENGGTSLSFYEIKIFIDKKTKFNIPYEVIMGKSLVSNIAKSIKQFIEKKHIMGRDKIDFNRELDDLFIDNNNNNKDLEESFLKDNIFLTGATGFLGAFLLRDYLEYKASTKVFCLVRAETENEGIKRIIKNMKRWNVWNEEYLDRIYVVCGDLSEKSLGLSEEKIEFLQNHIDIICHNGCEVNFSIPYSKIKQTNVLGTREIINILINGKKKKMEYMSTISVFSKEDYMAGCVSENTMPKHINNLALGYAQSKVIVEYMLQDVINKKYHIDIFRIGRIMGSLMDGQENHDMFYKMNQLCKSIGIYPDISMSFDCIPVDVVSKVITYISMDKKSANTYHVIHPNANEKQDLKQIFGVKDNDMKGVSWDEWYEKCKELIEKDNILAKQVFISLNNQFSEVEVEIKMDNMLSVLDEIGMVLPDIGHLINKIHNHDGNTILL